MASTTHDTRLRVPAAAKEQDIVNARFMAHARLDRCLARFARRPELFGADCLRLAAALDTRGLDLEVSDPQVWRPANAVARVAVEIQFSTEIDGMRTMGREEELRLALRIEFARARLERALGVLGLGPEERTGGARHSPAICRRRLEWHALRLEMVERNLYLALINVERYRRISAERSDLIQAAAAAMFRAVDGFDWRRGVLFRTYAVHWLNQGFRSHLYNFNSTVRVPVYLQKSIKHVNAAIERLGNPHASDDEIAQETGLRLSLIASSRTAVRRMRSLDAPIAGLDGTHTLANELALPDSGDPYTVALEDVSVESGVEAALGRLNERERRVVRMRFGIGCEREHIYSEVAAELGVSLERVRQILVRAIAKMRTPRLRKMLEPLLS